MFKKLEGIKSRYDELTGLISQSEIIADQEKWRALMKEHSNLEDIVFKYNEYSAVIEETEGAKELLLDEDFAEVAQQELNELEAKKEAIIDELKVLMLPKDPNDEKNVIMEIRAGTGGDEAALFGANLLRMYTRYAERHNYKTEVMSSNLTELGGVKEIIFSISGKGAYSRLKYESGVHRVQRVPETESSGRIHTSAATVAVLPEAEDVDVEISQNDLRIDVYRSGGHGGQSVNTTDSAVRITHIPTGLVVVCQDEKSQLKNKEKAMRVLKSRLLDLYTSQQESELALNRKSQVGSGDRSERIRTYNFPQGRVSDHRVNITLYNLAAFLDGDCDEIIDALIVADRAAALSGQ